MFNGSNCDRKSQLSGILTEPLNPRVSGSKGHTVQWNCYKAISQPGLTP